jgi:hypothetical protein
VLTEDDFAVVLRSGSLLIRVANVGLELRAQPFTVFGWEVEDLVGQIDELVARGVEFLCVDSIEQDEHRIWTAPAGTQVAWLRDPDRQHAVAGPPCLMRLAKAHTFPRPPRGRVSPQGHLNRRGSRSDVPAPTRRRARSPSDHYVRCLLVDDVQPRRDILPLAIAGTGYGIIGILVIVLLVILFLYFARRA